MKSLLSLTLLFTLSLTSFAQEEYDLPTDPNTPVLTFDYSGGFRMRPPEGFVKKPQLQIFPDGRVLRSPNGPDLPSSEMKISQEQLQSFLKRIVEENKFYEVNPAAIKEQIAKTGEQIMIADAPNVDVSIKLGQGQHEVSIYAVSFAARQFPKIESLSNMAAIEKLCRQLIAITDLGGYEKLEAAIDVVNKKLAADHPEVSPMTIEQLQYAAKNGDGNVTASFNAIVEAKGKSSSVRANYIRKADNSEEVTVNIYPIRQR